MDRKLALPVYGVVHDSHLPDGVEGKKLFYSSIPLARSAAVVSFSSLCSPGRAAKTPIAPPRLPQTKTADMRGLAASTSALLVAAAGTAAAADCYDGLYLIVARGTGEPKGPGSMGIIADDIAESIGDSKVLGLDYPATFSDPDYDDSETTGAETLQKVLTKYVGGCPDSKVAIMGYSQVRRRD